MQDLGLVEQLVVSGEGGLFVFTYCCGRSNPRQGRMPCKATVRKQWLSPNPCRAYPAARVSL